MKRNLVLTMLMLCLMFNYAWADTILLDNVPFKSQSPPGNWAYNSNCGPTSALMLGAYYEEFTPTTDDLKEIIDWLYENKYIYAQTKEGAEYYDGNLTNMYHLKSILTEYYTQDALIKRNQNDFSVLEHELRRGNPLIVAVHARMETNTTGHFMVLVGIDNDNDEVIVHDPGRTEGAFNRYPKSKFINSWRSSNYASMVVDAQMITWHPEGALIKTGSNTRVYVLADGEKHWIETQSVFDAHDFNLANVTTVSDVEIDCYNNGWVVDWEPVREVFQVDGVIYLLEKHDASSTGGALYEFASEFAYYSWTIEGQLSTLTREQAEVQYFDRYEILKTLYVRDGTLLKPDFDLPERGSGVVFIAMNNGELKGFLNYPMFLNMGYDLLPLHHVDENQFYASHRTISENIGEQEIYTCVNNSYTHGAGPDDDTMDWDNDGYSVVSGDCADNNDTVHPGAQEICDGIDNDCNWQSDEGSLCSSGQECVDGQCELLDQSDGDTETEDILDGDVDEEQEHEVTTSLDCYHDSDCIDEDPCTIDFCYLDACHSVYLEILCDLVDEVDGDDVVEDGDELIVDGDQDVHDQVELIDEVFCSIRCPSDMKAYAWYGSFGESVGNPAEINTSIDELCLRGRPWVDFNCACTEPFDWACYDWREAEIECNHEFNASVGEVDFNGEGEIWFTDFSCD